MEEFLSFALGLDWTKYPSVMFDSRNAVSSRGVGGAVNNRYFYSSTSLNLLKLGTHQVNQKNKRGSFCDVFAANTPWVPLIKNFYEIAFRCMLEPAIVTGFLCVFHTPA